jgi:hypothetical protein
VAWLAVAGESDGSVGSVGWDESRWGALAAGGWFGRMGGIGRMGGDDRETARRLFELVSAIAEVMISHPKTVNEMDQKLREAKRKAIEGRDKS